MKGASNGRTAARAPRKAHLVGVHSFRGGTGRTTVAANLSFLMARGGARVAVVDADLQAPALHLALGVERKRILHSISEFVQGQCELGEVPIDLSHELGVDGRGSLHFLPSSADLQTSTSILLDGYDVARLNDHLLRLAADLELDALVLDTHLGINRETLLSLAISDTVLVLLRPDRQDQQGAAILVEMATKVGVPSCLLVPNMVPDGRDPVQWSAKVEGELGVRVAGVLPWCAQLPELGCDSLFAARYLDHPFTAELERICQGLMPVEAGTGEPS